MNDVQRLSTVNIRSAPWPRFPHCPHCGKRVVSTAPDTYFWNTGVKVRGPVDVIDITHCHHCNGLLVEAVPAPDVQTGKVRVASSASGSNPTSNDRAQVDR